MKMKNSLGFEIDIKNTKARQKKLGKYQSMSRIDFLLELVGRLNLNCCEALEPILYVKAEDIMIVILLALNENKTNKLKGKKDNEAEI